jgi:hypothetical protein
VVLALLVVGSSITGSLASRSLNFEAVCLVTGEYFIATGAGASTTGTGSSGTSTSSLLSVLVLVLASNR